MRIDSKQPSDKPDWQPSPAGENPPLETANPGRAEESRPRKEAELKGQPEEAELDQLPFAESVKILSEAMKASYKRMSGQDASASGKPAGETLDDLLQALASALDRAGLEKSNQAGLTRIIGDIRNSMQYQPKGGGGVQSGPNPNLLDLSA